MDHGTPLGGKWMAAGVVWVFALSPMIIKLHARTVSEVVIAAMLAWVCVLVLDEERPLWQIILGAVLAALAVLTRQNMVLILPLLVLYVFWQHGRQKGVWSLVVSVAVFLAVHAYYWPNILAIWAPWLPDSLTPFLDAFRLPKDAIPVWDPSIDFWNRTNAFFQGMRYHFIALVGGTFAIMFWAPRSAGNLFLLCEQQFFWLYHISLFLPCMLGRRWQVNMKVTAASFAFPIT
jgi:4-amino-4-deoxy-L-arabinose transferase-like glycosyltransferase